MRERKVTVEEARRFAVRAQALDGSATGVLETIRRLGFLQIDVVQPVERPQHLVLYSRLGSGYDRAELDRLLWEEKALFEWDAFIYPIEDLPLVQARIREFRRSRRTKSQRWVHEFLTSNRAFRRYVMRELQQNGDCRAVVVGPWRTWHGIIVGADEDKAAVLLAREVEDQVLMRSPHMVEVVSFHRSVFRKLAENVMLDLGVPAR